MDVKKYLSSTIHLFFLVYTAAIFLRIVLSWVPAWQDQRWARFVSFCVDPFLLLFRRILPPIGGRLDLSPMLAFFVLRALEGFLIGLLR